MGDRNCYIGRCPCGSIHAATVDDPARRGDVAEFVAGMIVDGLTVSRAPSAAVRLDTTDCKCPEPSLREPWIWLAKVVLEYPVFAMTGNEEMAERCAEIEWQDAGGDFPPRFIMRPVRRVADLPEQFRDIEPYGGSPTGDTCAEIVECAAARPLTTAELEAAGQVPLALT